MFKNIVIPYDGSSTGARALPFATRLAQAESGRIVLVQAIPEPTIPVSDPSGLPIVVPPEDETMVEQADLEQARAELGPIVEQLRSQGVTAETEVVEYVGRAASAIVMAAREAHADLIAMSTHGRSGLGRFLYGSVAEQILKESHLPILIVPPATPPAWSTGQTETSGPVVVALDGSPFSEEALAPATELARVLRTGLLLIEVVEPSYPPVSPDGAVVIPMPTEDLEAQAREYLKALTARLQGPELSVQAEVGTGHAVSTIQAAASAAHALAIVAATHGRTGLAEAVLGSVATGLLHGARTPILLVRPEALRGV